MKRSFLRQMGASIFALVLVFSLAAFDAAAAGGLAVAISCTDPAQTGNSLTLESGSTATLTATAADSTSPLTAADVDFAWSTSDSTSVTLSTTTGDTVTLTAASVTQDINLEITATATLKSDSTKTGTATYSVTVKANTAVTGLTLDKSTLDLAEGGTSTLTAILTPEDSSQKVSWTSDKPTVATVDEDGKVIAVAPGEATITAQVGTLTATCKVTVRAKVDATAITLHAGDANVTTLSLEKDKTATLTAILTPSDATTEITWNNSDTEGKILKMEGEGKNVVLTGIADGIATITVTTSNGLSAQCKVTVGTPNVPVTGVITYPESLRLEAIGQTDNVQAIVSPSTADDTSVTWASADTSIATVKANEEDAKKATVTAVGPGETKITATSNSNKGAVGTCVVTVSGIKLSQSTLTMMVGKTQNLTYTTFGAAQVSGSPSWQSSDNTVAYVSGGRISARAVGETEITATIGNYSAKCTVKVTENTTGLVTSSVTQGVPLALTTLRAQMNSASVAATGSPLAYVTNLSVPTSQGILYYGYISSENTGQGVSGTAKYYYSDGVSGQQSLGNVTFVPKADFLGTATITYTGYSTKNEMFQGSIVLQVNVAGGSGTGTTTVPQGDINYSTSPGAAVAFSAANFEEFCVARTGETLSYVMFSQPSSRVGRLYYNYRGPNDFDYGVGPNTAYYYDKVPFLSYVTFVPSSNELDSASINFTAYGNGNTRCEGTVVISYVTNNSKKNTDGVITYSTRLGHPVSIQASDFNDLSQDMTGRGLNYVYFTGLPNSSQGTLYYDFTSAARPGTAITTSTRCHYNGTPSLASVAFIPKSNFSGTVAIPFTGYDNSGYQFKGTLRIQVDANDYVVRYSVVSGESVPFQTKDFEELSIDATGKSLDYIQFSTPAITKGVLYYQLENDETTSAEVKTTDQYYRVGKNTLLSNVNFTANPNFTGTVEIPFSGISTNGEKFTGRVEIEVYIPPADSVRYSGSSLPIRFRGDDFNKVCQAALGADLRSLQFTNIPDSEAGTLCTNYVNYHSTGQPVYAGTTFYPNNLDSISFVAKPGYRGLVTLSYNAFDVKGNRVTGSVAISVSDTCESHFRDMGNYSWASPAVEFLREYGVVKGVNDTQFAPDQPTLRCEFVTMLCRTFGLSSNSTSSFSDVPADSYYAGPVAVAKELGITSGTGGNRFGPMIPLSRQDAMVLLIRTMRVVGLEVADGAYVNWSEFSDAEDIADYARDSVGSMIEMGLVKGDGTGILNPNGDITRAEMAVILYRLLAR